MSFMNGAIRQAGNRSRSLLPDIGQTPAVQAANAVMSTQAVPSQAAQPSPMAAPNIQPQTALMHPPGQPADPNQYNYEPQPDGAWRVYPPGVQAPPQQMQASLPRAASTADYRRMQQAFQPPTPS